LSPRCARRRPDDDDDHPRADAVAPVAAAYDPLGQLASADDGATRRRDDVEAVRSSVDEPVQDGSSSQIISVQSVAGVGATGSSDDVPAGPDARTVVDDEGECWTTVEKTTCACLALMILVVIFAIYLQLTRRYFTGVHADQPPHPQRRSFEY